MSMNRRSAVAASLAFAFGTRSAWAQKGGRKIVMGQSVPLTGAEIGRASCRERV